MEKADPRRGWPLQLTRFFEQPSSNIAVPISILGIILFVALIIIGFLAVGWLLADLLSGDQKRAAEATKAALPVLAGAIGLPLLIWRLVILDRQTHISEEKTQIDRETHYTSIFSRAIDQLGQTREVKHTRSDPEGEGTELVARTAPNIEVRLGGIHSLVRLAEESARDREKIENTLLAYVRENSWSDREGTVTPPWQGTRPSSWGWSYPYSTGKVTSEAKDELKSWEEKQAEQSKQKSNWARRLKETRVDVSEAVEAISKVQHSAARDKHPRFYECLFVGAIFEQKILNLCRFDHCTFVHCSFEPAFEYRFLNSSFSDCTFRAIESGRASFSRCNVDQLTIQKMKDASFNMIACNVSGLIIREAFGGTLDLSHSSCRGVWISGQGEVKLNFAYAALAGGRISNLKALPSSDLRNCALANTRLHSLDLSAVRQISEATLHATEGDPATRHPECLSRPFVWDAFDPNYIDDDIPF